MDLAKTFHYIAHDFIAAKLHAYRSSKNTLVFLYFFTSFIRCAPKAELVNFADDNTLYVSNKDLTKLFEIPQKEFFEIVIE